MVVPLLREVLGGGDGAEGRQPTESSATDRKAQAKASETKEVIKLDKIG